ncbi:MaoC family dehydratase N-terminal domain-containing protein [Rhodobacteraceae bacterium NNCM2]|nr:MaoC family dehydratase N-terminal domain-containing protein [Coraliihabitans acroporae]
MTSLSDIDFDHLNTWIGSTETAEDYVTPGLIDRFHATFGNWLTDRAKGAPMGLHWCLGPVAVPFEELGPDGHPARGGFLPPVPFENRMWAGGSIRFLGPISGGETVTRTSRIDAITPKEGRSGPLVFVNVSHTHWVGDRVAIEERQDIVYRPAQSLSALKTEAAVEEIPADAFVGDAVTLFRYSAMTFNGHRIHYDFPYVTEEEGYPGLVVHGPLQATLLFNAAADLLGTSELQLDYRGLSPLIAGRPVSIRHEGDRIWLEKPDGTVTFEGRFQKLPTED